MAADRQNDMNESITVVATTTLIRLFGPELLIVRLAEGLSNNSRIENSIRLGVCMSIRWRGALGCDRSDGSGLLMGLEAWRSRNEEFGGNLKWNGRSRRSGHKQATDGLTPRSFGEASRVPLG